MPMGNSPGISSQGILVGLILVGRLGAHPQHAIAGPGAIRSGSGKKQRAHLGHARSLDSLWGSSGKLGTMQRILAWPLRNEDMRAHCRVCLSTAPHVLHVRNMAFVLGLEGTKGVPRNGCRK